MILFFLKKPLLSIIFILLFACSSEIPAPVIYGITPILKEVINKEKITESNYVIYTIKSGDTLSKISKKFGVSIESIIKENDIQRSDKIFSGQTINLYIENKNITSSSKNNQNIPEEKKIIKSEIIYSKESNFIWPTKGDIIINFGKRKNGLVSDGINIKAPDGKPILSTASGKVIFVGSEIRGFGNLIMIRHENGFISAYAHLKSITIKKGQFVKQGEKIGLVGKSGYVKTSQLHFELRKGIYPVDPRKFLGKI